MLSVIESFHEFAARFVDTLFDISDVGDGPDDIVAVGRVVFKQTFTTGSFIAGFTPKRQFHFVTFAAIQLKNEVNILFILQFFSNRDFNQNQTHV